jgi:hypothetical protein
MNMLTAVIIQITINDTNSTNSTVDNRSEVTRDSITGGGGGAANK